MNDKMSLYQKVIHCNKYARFLPEMGRREYWGESVDRYVNFIVSEMYKNLTCNPVDVAPVIKEIRNIIYKMRAMPSMRLFFSAGKAVRKEHQMAFNCKFQSMHDLKSFADLLYSLMCTCGVGCSVEKQYIEQLPSFPKTLDFSKAPIFVEDSRKGWASAFYLFLQDVFEAGHVREFDVSAIRKKGEILQSSGGTASGPEPLLELRQFVADMAFANRGQALTSVHAFDIICKIAGCVVAGGLRRSAIITLFDEDDDAMFHVKDPEVLGQNYHRYNSNNTVVATKPETIRKVMETCRLNGEPGIMFKNNVDKKMAKLGRTLTRGSWGMNPCSEIILRPNQLCVAGDTRLIAKDGLHNIEDVVGIDIEIWNGEEWCNVKPYQTGEADELYRVRVSDGSYLDVTGYHKFLVKNRFQKDFKEVTALELIELLKTSDYGLQAPRANIQYSDNCGQKIDSAYEYGFFVGDGFLSYNKEVATAYTNVFLNSGKPFDSLKGEKVERTYYQDYKGKSEPFRSIRLTTLKTSLCEFIKYGEGLPREVFSWNRESILNFVAGWADADGTNTGNGIRVYGEYNNLRDLQLLLAKVGYNSSLNLMAKKGSETNFAIRKQDVWYVQLVKTAGIPCRRLSCSNEREARGKGKFQIYKSVEKLEGLHKSYCLTEDKLHQCVFNNILTKQCNLVEAVLRPGDSLAMDLKKVRVATIMGLIQATLTDYNFVDEELTTNQREDPIIGVSLTGIQDCPQYSNLNGRNIKALKSMVDNTVEEYWDKFGLKFKPLATTTIKPSGTVGLLVNASSGIHARYAKHYIKRTVIGEESELYEFLADSGVPYLEVDSVDGRIFEFPVEAPKDSKIQEDFSLNAQLDAIANANRNWCQHNVSATVYVKDDEWDELTERLIASEDFLSLSFLPVSVSTDTSGFAYLPLEAIAEADFKKRKEIEDNIDWKKIAGYYKEKHIVSEEDEMQKRDFVCSGGACTLE